MNRSEAGKLGAEKAKLINLAKFEARIENYNLTPTLCKQCGNGLDYSHRTNKFCSSSCSAVYNNHKRTKIHKCLYCDKELLSVKYIRKYCSIACRVEYLLRTNDRLTHEGFNSKVNSNTIKRYLLAKYGHVCHQCSYSEWLNGPIVLELHHIDGNHTNNRFDNLQLLCPNCHSMTDNYKAKNKNGTRKYRNASVV